MYTFEEEDQPYPAFADKMKASIESNYFYTVTSNANILINHGEIPYVAAR